MSSERQLYKITRSKIGPRTVKLSLPEGAWELTRDADPEKNELGSVTIGLDAFMVASIEAKGHFKLKPAERKPPVPSIPRAKPTTEEKLDV